MGSDDNRLKKTNGATHRPARKGAGRTTDAAVRIWDEDSQRLMESLSHDRKRATEEDYEDLGRSGSGVTRGDAAND